MVKYYSLLDNVRVNHGGMTKACFRRGKAIYEVAGIPTTILTFNDEPDYSSIVSKVRESPDLGDAEVTNFYCSLADRAVVKAIGRLADRYADVSVNEYLRSPSGSARVGESYSVEKLENDSRQQRTYFDEGGRPFLVIEDPKTSGRAAVVTLLSRGFKKRVVFQGALYQLKHLWLDTLIDGHEAILTFDDNRVARTFKDYVRPGVGKIFVQHVNHLEGGHSNNLSDPLRKSYRDVFRALGNFDAIVTLSSRQQAKVQQRLEPSCKVAAIPNVNFPPASTEMLAHRVPRKGVVVTRHAPEKQILHTIKAFALAHSRGQVDSLTIIGGPQDGDSYREVEAFVNKEGLSGVIEFEPHQNGAEIRFGEGGFSILSSTYEGFGLVLLEAMSRGAIPVSYDVPYGPKSIIADKEDGFLVPNRDIEALATAIGQAASLGIDHPMRTAAKEKAALFGPVNVSNLWTSLYEDIRGNFRAVDELRKMLPTPEEFRLTRDAASLKIRIAAVPNDDLDVELRLESFDSFQHSDVRPISGAGGSLYYEFEIGREARPEESKESVGLWVLLRQGRASTRCRLQWPDEWPNLRISRTPYGNLNI